MNAHVRIFEDKPAVREKVPLLIGLMGPSGGGKSFSALRLATGIQSAVGGDIFVIDTEAGRAKHYADIFKFRHIAFGEPFGALDYLAAIRHCVGKGAGVVVVDSASHEHEGIGGLIDTQQRELDRLAGDDYAKRERMTMLAWAKPKAARRQLINGLLQLNCNFVFCFRAKETSKPVLVNGKTKIVPQGFMPIAGDEFVYEQTLNCLLLPQAGGVPTWQSENPGERAMMKLPEQFRALFAESRPLSEETGRKLAEWAKGGAAPASPPQANGKIAPQSIEGEAYAQLVARADAASDAGMEALQTFWTGLSRDEKLALADVKDTLKEKAAKLGTPTPVKDATITVEEAQLRGRDAAMQGLPGDTVPEDYLKSAELADAWARGHSEAEDEAKL